MTGEHEKSIDTGTPLDRLADIADAIFERATKLEEMEINTKKKSEHLEAIQEMKREAFEGVINVWGVVIDLLPSSGLDQPSRKVLEIDSHKIISRCYHRLGNLEAAKRSITSAIDLGYNDGFISLGAIAMDCEEYDEAEGAFQSAIAKGVQTMRAHAGLGELYFKLGTAALKDKSEKHIQYFEKAEHEFLAAGKARFGEGYERAMELFDTIGWKEQAISFGEKAAQFYEDNRLKYGDKLRAFSKRLRKIAGDDRYDKILSGVGRSLGSIVGGGVRSLPESEEKK